MKTKEKKKDDTWGYTNLGALTKRGESAGATGEIERGEGEESKSPTFSKEKKSKGTLFLLYRRIRE